MTEHNVEKDADGSTCPTCGPANTERHPRRADVIRCANCKEWLESGRTVKASIVSVTPTLASEWLTRNHDNREVDTGAVKRYADAMLGGRWRLADQSVKFKIGGDLLDGQHRLMAVVRSGSTVPMLVLTDVEHWTVWHPGGANHLNTEWCYTCDLERTIADLRASPISPVKERLTNSQRQVDV